MRVNRIYKKKTTVNNIFSSEYKCKENVVKYTNIIETIILIDMITPTDEFHNNTLK